MQGPESAWSPLLSSLPQSSTGNPLLWSEQDRQRLLRGTSIQQEASTRAQVHTCQLRVQPATPALP